MWECFTSLYIRDPKSSFWLRRNDLRSHTERSGSFSNIRLIRVPSFGSGEMPDRYHRSIGPGIVRR